MNREILFRGKRIDNGEWVEGYVVVYPSGKMEVHKKCTQPPDILLVCETDPETVCQYTGLTDKNGRKIFEGDICEFSAYGESYKGDVRFIKGNFTIWCGKCAPFLDDALEKRSAIVIGNIFDNPELIGEQS